MKRFALMLLLLAASAAPATTQPDWVWERNTPTCSLLQAYASPGSIIQLSRTPGSDETSIRIGGTEPMFVESERLPDGKVRFLPSGQSDAEVYVAKAGDQRQISVSSDDPAFLSKFAEASEIEIAHEKLETTRVPLRSAGAAVEAIQKCEDTRMREWGIDPVSWRALKVRPLPAKDWNKFISSSDYPIGALLDGKQGSMVLRLDVGPDGRVRNCEQRIGERLAERQPRVCSKIKSQARFEPAIGAAGQPVAAPYVLVIRFRIA